MGIGPKLKRVAKCSRGERHRTSLGFFLNRSDWDEAGLLVSEAQRMLRRLRMRKGDVLDLILDDTRCVKRGRTMADISKLWISASALWPWSRRSDRSRTCARSNVAVDAARLATEEDRRCRLSKADRAGGRDDLVL